MRQLIDIQDLWQKARRVAEATLDEHGESIAPTVPVDCPYTLDELLADDIDLDAALAKLHSA